MDLVPPAQKPFFAGGTLVVEAGHYQKNLYFHTKRVFQKTALKHPFQLENNMNIT